MKSNLAHYRLPEGNVQISFSGGRTSAYMLHKILEANGDLPEDRCKVMFQNTGREMEETLDFVQECGQRWGVMITWTEYRATAPFFDVVGYQGASRNGEPFDALIDKKQYLPNQQSRFCTQELKIRTAKRYLRSIGWDRWTAAVGIRADEPHRLGKPAPKERWTNWHPLASAGVSRHLVGAFWARQPFDLQLPNIRGNCWLGNCDGCFLKSERSQSVLARDFPDRHAWWEEAEARIGRLETSKGRPKDNSQFSKRYSKRELREFMERQGDWALETEGVLCQKDDGECIAA
ncbi:MAG: phosphoadenosine phosphosulfate reductase family protein [Rhizobiales bacterium]|nr:phosphoadenosine phosphosulfate reductase family protein [Hyphomicrobiales bacterium]